MLTGLNRTGMVKKYFIYLESKPILYFLHDVKAAKSSFRWPEKRGFKKTIKKNERKERNENEEWQKKEKSRWNWWCQATIGKEGNNCGFFYL